MQKFIFGLIVFSVCVSCNSYGMRTFSVSETENSAAWSRAHVAMFKNFDYSFDTVNEYIIYGPKSGIYITREKIGGQYLYSICYYGPDSYEGAAISLEYIIRNIKEPENNEETRNNRIEQKIDKQKIEMQDKTKAKRRVLPNGQVVWE
jgi:hypothetical protein